jgi:hypothetical protein
MALQDLKGMNRDAKVQVRRREVSEITEDLCTMLEVAEISVDLVEKFSDLITAREELKHHSALAENAEIKRTALRDPEIMRLVREKMSRRTGI